jgi:hypothetical protein
MTLEDIQQAIAKLSADERERLRVWFARFDAAPSGQSGGEAENTAHKLGRLAGRTLGELRKRLRED